MQAVLAQALGVLGVVRKQRLLYLVGQTRVHLDTVEGLGDFVELEVSGAQPGCGCQPRHSPGCSPWLCLQVVLGEEQSEEDGERLARRLLGELGVEEQDLIAGAYLDLLLAKGEAGSGEVPSVTVLP